MKLVFEDETFSYELLRTVAHAPYGGSDLGECLSTAYRIGEGDLEGWYREWSRTAERVRRLAEDSLAAGREVSAREAFLRASNYYRCAEFFLHEDAGDPRMLEAWGASRDAFNRAAGLFERPFEAVEIPYEDTTLPGHFYSVDASGVPRPTLIFHGGFDSTIEELYFAGALAALRRGYNVLTFEGPGQGRVIREQGIPFRHDWEKVVTPVVDYALSRREVDPKRVALMGWSYGGYLAPRAAAFEHRLAALIAWDGLYDLFDAATSAVPSIFRPIVGRVVPGRAPVDPTGSRGTVARRAGDAFVGLLRRRDTGMRWALGNGAYTFGVRSPLEYVARLRDYSLEGVAGDIACPTLVCEGERDHFFEGQPRKLYDALECTKTYALFTAEEGAEEHCQSGASTLFHARAFDWLDAILDRSASSMGATKYLKDTIGR